MSDKAGRNGNVVGTKWRLQPGSPWDRERGREEARCKREWEREETLLALEWGATCTHNSQSQAGRRKTVMARQAWTRSGARLEVGGAWSSNLIRARPLRERASTTMNVWL